MLVADQAVQVDRLERDLAGELQPVHDHARHPEEQDVVAGLHHGGRVEILVVGRLFRPAERGERPQAGGEPGIQHIRVLVDVLRAAVDAGGRVLACAGLFAAIGAVPDRDAVPPPQLAGDAPVPDIFQPVEIDLFEAFRDDLDAPIPDGCQGCLGQRRDLDEPLLRDHRLDDLAATLRTRHVERIRLLLDDQPGGFHVLP